MADELPFSGPCGGNDAISIGDGGSKVGGVGQGVAELGGKVLQPADEGIFLKNNFSVPSGEDLQRVALADTHGAAYLLGNYHSPQVVNASHDSGCFHIKNSLYFLLLQK